jgi:hypothetical protein
MTASKEPCVLKHSSPTVVSFRESPVIAILTNAPKRLCRETLYVHQLYSLRAQLIPNLNQPTKSPSEQPNPCEQPPQKDEEPNPHLPAHPRPVRHPQHPLHRAPQPHPRPLKLIINRLRQTTRIAYLIANRYGELFQLPDLLRQQRCRCGVVLGFERLEHARCILPAVVGGGGAEARDRGAEAPVGGGGRVGRVGVGAVALGGGRAGALVLGLAPGVVGE